MPDQSQLAQIRASVAMAKKSNDALKAEIDFHLKAGVNTPELQEHLKTYYANKSTIERMIQVYGG